MNGDHMAKWQFSIRDLLWCIVLCAAIISWYRERQIRVANEIDVARERANAKLRTDFIRASLLVPGHRFTIHDFDQIMGDNRLTE